MFKTLFALAFVFSSSAALAESYYRSKVDLPNGMAMYNQPGVYTKNGITHYFSTNSNLNQLCQMLGSISGVTESSRSHPIVAGEHLVTIEWNGEWTIHSVSGPYSIIETIHCK